MNRYALVTGSSRSIGRVIAIELAKNGFDIFINFKESEDKAKEVVSEIKRLGRGGILSKLIFPKN